MGDIATYIGKTSIYCVRTKYESNGRVRKGLVNGDINSSGKLRTPNSPCPRPS